MYGIEAINAHNGWAMAIAGALIVMTGLAVLSFVISRLHKILEFFENRRLKKSTEAVSEKKPPRSTILEIARPLSELDQTATHYQALTDKLGGTFDITSLYQICIQNEDPHPHLTIRTLREEGYLVPAGEGVFTWKHK